MRTHEGVNDRIMREIDKLDTNLKAKNLLKSLLQIELENYDQEKGRYVEEYKSAFAKYMGINQ